GHPEQARSVAPRPGAWIETATCRSRAASSSSPPVRGRGLKLGGGQDRDRREPSPPVRGRGLKLALWAAADGTISGGAGLHEGGRRAMGSSVTKGVIRSGRVEVEEPIDLPDGSVVTITGHPHGRCVGLSDDDRPPTTEEIAATLAAMDAIEPLELSDDE